MTRLVRTALWAALALAVSLAPGAAAAETGLPPLLDRELFFGNPEIAAAQLSPDGQYVAFLKPWSDTRNIWVKKTAEPFDAARRVTAEAKRPIPGFFWTRDSRLILYVKDNDGDENFNVWAVDPAAPKAEGKDVPASRNLTDAKGARAFIYDVPKKSPDTIHVGLNDRDAAWHDLYQVTISTGKRELLRKNTDRIAQWVFDLDGQLRLAVRTTDKGDTEILKVLPDGFKTVYTCTVFETCSPERFHKDGKRVYMQTNKGDFDLVRLVLFDPETGNEETVESDPLKRVDFGNALFSEATDDLVGTSYEDERVRLYFRDKAWEADYKLLQSKFPGKDIVGGSSTADDRLWLLTAASDEDPGARYIFDRRTKALTLQYKVRERIPREHMAAMKAVRYPSSDGLEIPAFLTLPRGVAAKALPTVLLPHGGPWARDGWGFNNLAQFLANRGYAVLMPNFRGSTGYGKKFLNAGNKQWGDKMQDDVTWGAKYLVAQGIADPKRIGIMGGSYGGYTTLAGVAFTPDLYAAAVDIVGPSNLITLMDSIPPYWESFRIIFHERMGNPKTPEGKAQLERQSPLNSAQKIKTPLLVAQGANDPRVKKAEAEQIVIALRDRGFPVEYILAPDEGHGFARPVNSMALWAASEAFLAKHLGGRFQQGGTTEVVARLKEITVDPKTVVLSKTADKGAVGVPKVVASLAPGSASYQGRIEAGGQKIPLTIVATIEDKGATWLVTDTAKMPMGDAVDVTTVDKATLVPRKRSIKQGPAAIELAFEGGKATGTVAIGGEPKPVSVDIGGDLFADGAGSFEAISALPLADGYSATFRNFDPQQQKLQIKQAKVLGAEDVTVPAGTFKAWKVEIASVDGEPGQSTIWVATDSRKVLKSVTTLPQMGGAVVTAELQP
ncbi:MAG TPA: alpha/beta fold hydrolase [Vicinamibacteria bacterium]|nr:alpha/beta fold hydrolase [Vicinamibacteria bacterium]